MLKNVYQHLKEWQTFYVWVASLLASLVIWLFKESPYINFLFSPITLNFAYLFLVAAFLIFITVFVSNYTHDNSNKSKLKKAAKEFKDKWKEYSSFMSQFNDFKDKSTLDKYLDYRNWFIGNFSFLEDALTKYLFKIKPPMQIGYEQTIVSNIKNCYHYGSLPEQKDYEGRNVKPKDLEKMIFEFCSSVINS